MADDGKVSANTQTVEEIMNGTVAPECAADSDSTTAAVAVAVSKQLTAVQLETEDACFVSEYVPEISAEKANFVGKGAEGCMEVVEVERSNCPLHLQC
jgi:hypothetical protein